MATTVRRYEVPVDDAVHSIPCGYGDVLHVDCRRDPGIVEFWMPHFGGSSEADAVRHFTVVGTGHPVPVGKVRGTALTPERQVGGYGRESRGALVWHLVETPTAELHHRDNQ